MQTNETTFILQCKALGDENRWRILQLLQSGEKCACVLLTRLDISQPTLSHHMKILCDAGLVTPRREGKWTHYSLNTAVAQQLQAGLGALLAPAVQGAGESCACTAPQMNKKAGDAAPANQKTKLYILTGFLGSGKTTLLTHILEATKGHKIGIIQNEVGKLGIDGEILRDDDIKMVELNRGSIFCSCLKLSFVQALADMAAMNFEYLFVESSGIGDPSNVQELLDAAAVIAGDKLALYGEICMVDAVNFFEQLGDMEAVTRQLKHCHLAVLTKVDLVDAARVEALKAKIREINPVCRMDTCANGNLDMGFLQEDLLQYTWAGREESTNSPATKPKTLFMQTDESVSMEKLTAFLQKIAPHVYRVKGFCQIDGMGWQQIDLVGTRVDTKPCEAKEKSELVFISSIGSEIIKELFAAWQSHIGTKMQLKN